ncbi:MAG: CRISPR system precrRNA processing endoribonuclease RAMP protein Cas6, partial [Prevotellaceae bacterium]|nr:CRISPR system precrRNA processing endoribonuclease RAMP protein Cas6 [Prevotellaceae bacterium]
DDVVFDAWTGAVIRNNLLYAADNVRIEDSGQTLRERIDAFPLNETHPLYKELKDGFPKAYVLTNFSHSDLQSSSVSIKKNEVFSFSLILIGSFCEYKSHFFRAIRLMCERGIGKPQTPFLLLDIAEQSLSGESQIMAVAQADLSEELRYPVRLADFSQNDEPDEFSEIFVRYVSPVILFRLKTKKNTQLSYQDKCNRFPSFYQLVRSAFFRLQKLYAIYCNLTMSAPIIFEEILMDTYLETAGHPLLVSSNIQYITLKNTQKKEKVNDMPLAGYIGEQIYSGYFRKYMALLRFMAEIGVGHETVYGLGKYEVERKNLK